MCLCDVAPQSGKARNVVQRDAVADTTATLSHYCSAYSKADTDKVHHSPCTH